MDSETQTQLIAYLQKVKKSDIKDIYRNAHNNPIKAVTYGTRRISYSSRLRRRT